jgi:hypothetical protein
VLISFYYHEKEKKMRVSGIIKIAHGLPEFPDLIVSVPRRIGQEIEIVPVDMTERETSHFAEETDNFTLIRPIANIALFRSDHLAIGNFEEPVKEFDPPIEFRIKYGDLELEHVDGDVQQLKLAYWVPERWVIISDVFHEYQILPHNFARIAEVKIWSWVGDPTLAWGR